MKNAANHVANDALRHLAERAHGSKCERPPRARLPQIAFLDENANERGNGGLGQFASIGGQMVTHLRSGLFAAAPEGVHDFQFSLRQFFNAWSGHVCLFGSLDLVL